MFQAIKYISIPLKRQTPYKVSFPTTTECSYKSVIENWKTHKFMEIEQHTLNKDQIRDQSVIRKLIVVV